MITFAAPGFLAAGALLALTPLILHMLARTPPERRPLPTARFLEADARTRLRLRRPANLLLLALRMAFLLLLGAAFAGPGWVPDRQGTGQVVLLDVGAGTAPAWQEAVDVAAERLAGGGALVVFDSVARVVGDGAGALDSIAAAGPTDRPSSYLAALRGLRLAAGALTADSATAVLITRPHWAAWSGAVPAARETAWPARIELVAVGRDAAAPDPEPTGAAAPTGLAAVLAPDAHPLRPYAAAALAALGYEAAADGEAAEVVLVLPGEGDRATDSLTGSRRVVFIGGSGAEAGGAPWRAPERDDALPRSRGRLVLEGGHPLAGWRPLGGRPSEAGRVVAVWEDGRPAAAAAVVGGRCVAYVAGEPVSPGVAADPGFPHLVEALANGCVAEVPGGDAMGSVELDSGAIAVLEGAPLPPRADLSALAGDEGRPLTRVLLVLAFVLAMVEAIVAYVRKLVR